MVRISQNLYLDENGFILDYRTGLTYSLNPTGVFIIRELLEGTALAELTQAIAKKYGISHQTAADDLKEFLRQLSNNSLLISNEVPTDDSM